jgi:hypothetical protein
MIPDPIILSDDESVGAESGTDYGTLAVNLTAKNGSDPPYIADTKLADGDGFASGAALTSDRLVADHQDDDNINNSGVIDNTQLRLSADRPRAASPSHELVIHQASKLQANTGISVNIDVTTELEDEDFNVSAEGNDKDDDDTCSTKGRELSVISDKNPASDSNISELRVGQPDYTQTLQLSSAAASPQHSDLKNNHLPKQLRRRSATGNVRRKHPRTIAPIQLTSTASPVSVALEAVQSRALITAPVQEQEIRDIDQEIVDDESTDDSDDGDYADTRILSTSSNSWRRFRPSLAGLKETSSPRLIHKTSSQSRTVLSCEPEMISLPSGEKATEVTRWEWPSSVCSAAPVAATQSRIVDLDKISLPSGEKATE